jgi:hypothetical protein
VVRKGFAAYGEGSRSVSCSCPTPSSVESEAFVGYDLKDTSATEGLRVRLSLDLQNVEREKDNLSDTDETKNEVSQVVSSRV